MQALSSSALGSPLEAQATGDTADRERKDLADLRRAAVENIHESQRHRMGVLPGMISSSSVLVREDLPRFESPQTQLVPQHLTQYERACLQAKRMPSGFVL